VVLSGSSGNQEAEVFVLGVISPFTHNLLRSRKTVEPASR